MISSDFYYKFNVWFYYIVLMHNVHLHQSIFIKTTNKMILFIYVENLISTYGVIKMMKSIISLILLSLLRL